MKKINIISFACIVLLFISSHTYAQLIPGEWKGKFTQGETQIPISLKIELKADSSYEITSYSVPDLTIDGKEITEICSVAYFFPSADSVILEEKTLLNTADRSILQADCFQRMNLKIITHKKKTELNGTWSSTSERCPGKGKIRFWIKNKRK